MTGTLNFSFWRALVLHRQDDGIERLVRQLELLGLQVNVAWEKPLDLLPPCDIVLVDADRGWDGMLPWEAPSPVPVVALLGSEAPGRIAWALRQGAGAIIPKPIAPAAVYPALVMAAHAHEARMTARQQISQLEARVRLRPLVHEALRSIMTAQRLDEEAAYQLLRQTAMRRRKPVQALAADILAGHGPLPKAV